MIGDLICDDWPNTPECEFDGQDCCNSNSDFSQCLNCECLHWDNYTLSVSHTTLAPPPPPSCKIFYTKNQQIFKFGLRKKTIAVCMGSATIADGICDDWNNVIECNYDEGDCCMGIKGLNCVQCVCKDTYTGYPVLTTEPFNWHGWFKSLKKS